MYYVKMKRWESFTCIVTKRVKDYTFHTFQVAPHSVCLVKLIVSQLCLSPYLDDGSYKCIFEERERERANRIADSHTTNSFKRKREEQNRYFIELLHAVA